ncbi:MAG: hypothetical protein U1F41_13145 [Burkholderiales bacterium]
MTSDLRAFLVGLLLFIGGIFVFFESSTPGAGTLTLTPLSFVIVYCTPLLSGAACAFLAEQHRFGILPCPDVVA